MRGRLRGRSRSVDRGTRGRSHEPRKVFIRSADAVEEKRKATWGGASDPPIVPVKPPNKAEFVAAEAVEGRGGAKGNAVRSSTHQTQSWASVSQAMDRIRCAARRDKRVRLTALVHHVNVNLLRFAFHQLKRWAAPGVDGLTWHEYEADLEANLADLHGRVQRAPTGRSRLGGSTSPSPTAGNGRSASPHWRTSSSSARWWRC
jgi:hypothetical protein